MHENSRLIFERYCLPLFCEGMVILEVGPEPKGSTWSALLLDRPGSINNIYFADMNNVQADASKYHWWRMDGPNKLCVPADYFHVVMAAQVLEHVRQPWLWLPEMARVLKPGGLFISVSPITAGHHNAPVDCWRIWPDGMRALFEVAGLEEVKIDTYQLDKRGQSQRGQMGNAMCVDLLAVGRKSKG